MLSSVRNVVMLNFMFQSGIQQVVVIAIHAADAKGATACRLATLRTAPAGLRAKPVPVQSGIPPVNWLLIRQ